MNWFFIFQVICIFVSVNGKAIDDKSVKEGIDTVEKVLLKPCHVNLDSWLIQLV